MSKVHYWELSNYNNGVLVGRWFDLDNVTESEHQDEVQEWLDELSEETRGSLEISIEDLECELEEDEEHHKLTPAERTSKIMRVAAKKAELLHFCDYEEVILGDVEDVPSEYVGEWSIDSEFFELQEALENSHLDEEVFKAGIACGIPIESIEDAYHGNYGSDEELAEEYIDSGCMGDIPDHLANYIDTERLGNDLAHDFIEHDGHYFHANY